MQTNVKPNVAFLLQIHFNLTGHLIENHIIIFRGVVCIQGAFVFIMKFSSQDLRKNGIGRQIP